MDSAVNNPARGKPDRDPYGATALDVNTNPTNARKSGGGVNRTKSPFKAVRLIEQADSTTQNCERLRPGVREEEKCLHIPP
jgi:hypothetical protein